MRNSDSVGTRGSRASWTCTGGCRFALNGWRARSAFFFGSIHPSRSHRSRARARNVQSEKNGRRMRFFLLRFVNSETPSFAPDLRIWGAVRGARRQLRNTSGPSGSKCFPTAAELPEQRPRSEGLARSSIAICFPQSLLSKHAAFSSWGSGPPRFRWVS